MHRIHSIEISETDDRKHAIIFRLAGILDESMERILRLEFDKTLVRGRKGGVILDLTDVTQLSNAVVGRIVSFSRSLNKDHIQLVVVVSEFDSCNKMLIRSATKFNIVPDIEVAKELLGIEDEDV